MQIKLFLVILIFGTSAWALDIPKNLGPNDLQQMVSILGDPTSSKFLSNPFPLGGYSGFEVGLSSEFIDTSDLSRLGSGTSEESTFQYNNLSVGKGLYHNVDLFVHFIPFSNSNEITDYGGLLKWNFYQAEYLPLSLSILGHANTVNIKDSFINDSLGWDFMGGMNLNNVAFYLGGGRQNTRSTFASNILDTTDPHVKSQMSSHGTLILRGSEFHSFIGLQISFSSLFVAAQIDRYDQPAYSAKLGVRF